MLLVGSHVASDCWSSRITLGEIPRDADAAGEAGMGTRRRLLLCVLLAISLTASGCTGTNTATFGYYGNADTGEMRPGDTPITLPSGIQAPRLGYVTVNSYSDNAIVLTGDGQTEAAKCFIQTLKPGMKVRVQRNSEGQLTVTGAVE